MTLLCPYCDHENIAGVDFCEQCQQSLDDTYLPPRDSDVEQGLLNDRVSELNPKSPLSVPSSMPAGDVLRFMVEKQIGCVVVTEGDLPVGVFSERDGLMRLNTDAVELAECPVSDFMTRDLQTLEADAKIAFAAQRMDLGGFRHVPIVDPEGRLTGVISVRDFLRYVTEKMTTAGG